MALGALALVLAVALIRFQAGTSEEAPTASRTTSGTRQPLSAPTPPPRGNHVIRGRVLDAQRRPAPGTTVSATRAMPGESLSALPCDTSEEDMPLSSSNCLGESEELVKGLVEAGHGDTPVLAQALTSEDGTFQLDALPEGTVTLWAFGGHDAAMVPDIRAGADDVELRLEAGRVFPGRVIGESGAGLAGARVTLFHQAHSRFFEATTDTEGRFTFGPLPKGDYSAVAFAPDLLPEYHRGLDDAFTVITLHPSRGFSGRVLAEGSLVAGAEVHLVHSSRVTTTDQEGRFSFEQLSPGDYEVRAEHLGRHGFANVTLTEEGRALEPTIHLGTLVVVEGVVRDESGRPIAGAEVSVPGKLGLAPVVATTEADGRFRLGPLRREHYVFTAVARGYQFKQLMDVTLSHSNPPLEFILQRAHVVQGTVTEADGRPVPGAAVRVDAGEGIYVAGAVTDEQGHFDLDFPRPMAATLTIRSERHLPAEVPVEAPTPDLRVVLRAAARVEGIITNTYDVPLRTLQLSLTSDGQHPTQVTDSGDSGRFHFGSLPPGTYTLHAELDVGGVPQRASRTVSVQGTETVEASLRLDTGQPVSGIVVDERGHPVARAKVEGKPLQGERHSSLDDAVYSGPDGRFTLHHMPDGACELRAQKEGYDFESARKQFPGDSTPAVRAMAGDEDVRLELRSMGRVRGRLVRSNGTPITHFFINEQEFRDPEGAFRISARGPWGMPLEFAVPGLNHTTRQLDVSPGEEVDLGAVRMEAGRQIRGHVLDAETLQPIEGAFVGAYLPGQGRVAERGLHPPLVAGRTGPDGTFHLPLVEDRPLDLLVHPLNGAHPELRRPVGTGDMDLELRLYPGAYVEGAMTDRDGQPVEATVWLSPVGGDDPEPGIVSVEEAAGTFRAHKVPGGTYVLNIVKARNLEGRPVTFLAQRVQIPPMGRVTLAVREPPGSATVRLSVRLPPGLQEENIYFLALIPGSVPPATSTVELRRRAYSEQLFESPQSSGLSRVYEQLPAGRYTFIAIGKQAPWDAQLQAYREELTVTDGATLTRDIHVVLRPSP
ncbi:carboxypeptidase regulatory-like domain-containing protein [Myxococcus sp. Y35]|uniref:carboxypeptidase regulatory-like domain-containing protein n=1 Tax=Pseudomyxococcus flavus TaxID=3115648 RepID=UPI003CEF8387